MSGQVVTSIRRMAGLALALVLLATIVCPPLKAQDGPIGQLLKDLFSPGRPEPKKLDLIDRHAAAASRELTRSLEQCDVQIAQAQWDSAIRQLQHIVELPEDALILRPAGWVSIKRHAEEKLLRLPEDGRRFYLNQYQDVARDELDKARQRGDFDAICRVASRFRATPAGQDAADEVAWLLADSGDAVAAAQWLLELDRDAAPLTTTPAWKSRAAALFQRLGQVLTAQRFDPAVQPPSAPEGGAALPKASSTQWTEVYGGPSRLNSINGDQPLLLEEWSSTASQIESLQEDIVRRQEDLHAGGLSPFPVANVVAARGLMAARLVGGLEVREVDTGRLLWKARGQRTVEALLTRNSGENAADALTPGPADTHDAHPLSSFFYRDAVLGQLSTDGQRLFAIGRKSTLLSGAFDSSLWSSNPSGQSEDHAFNTIVALDFETGRSLWTAGGSTNDAPFEAPLAGVYFFGPPTVDGGELFVIGAHAGDVNLYCLEASTGLPKWKQFLALYDTPRIQDDVVRQMWSCTPLVTRGLVYCPTNAGWLVAVDRHRRRLAWATRYATTEISDRYQPQYTLSALNERWAQTAPLLSGGEIVFAPPELPDEPMQTDPHLFRVDAVTGRIVFRRGKAESLAVGGLYGEIVVVLGRQGVEGWPPLARWSTRWSTPYPPGLTPCGIGIAINDVYWVPFLEGAIVGFRLSDGAIQEVLKNDALAGRLGNLVVHRDRILSLGPTGLVGLWQKGPFESQLKERLAKNPRDPEARLRKARGLVSNQRFQDALNELETADIGAASSELLQEARDLQWECLTTLLAGSTSDDEARWKQLEQLSDSPREKQAVARMQIDRALSNSRWQEALDRCWTMTGSTDDLVEADGLHVRGDLWLSGRLLDLWTKAPDEVRNSLTRRIEEQTKRAPAASDLDRTRSERLFGFHSLGRAMSLQLGLADAANGDVALSESRLWPLITAPEAETSVAAITRLAELYSGHDSPQDALRMVAKARGLNPDTPLPGGTTLKAWLERQPAVADEPGARSPTAGWNLKGGQVVRLGAEREFEVGRPIWIRGRQSRWMSNKRLEFAGSWYGLSLLDRSTNRSEWTMPLSANGSGSEEWSPEATAAGNLLAICSRGMLHVCSPIDRATLWTWPLPTRFSTPSAYGWAEEQLANQPLQTIATAVNEFQANVGSLREGPLMAIAGGSLILLGQRELVVFDVRTGEELWRRDGMDAAAVLVADEETVCVSATASGPPAAFRRLDGRQLKGGVLDAAFKRTFAIEQDTVLTRQGLPALFSSKVRVVSERPHSGQVIWSQAITAETVIQRLPGNELVAIEPTGEVFLIDVDSGDRTAVGRLPAETGGPRREMHVLADADRIYVTVHRSRSYEFTHLSIPSISVNGELHAFNRKEGRLIWTHPVRDASVVTSRFADLPVVILAEQGVQPRRRRVLDALNLPELKLAVLDKRTGERVAEWSGVTQHGSPAALTVDPARQRIDLFLNHYSQNFSDRLRVQFASSRPPAQ